MILELNKVFGRCLFKKYLLKCDRYVVPNEIVLLFLGFIFLNFFYQKISQWIFTGLVNKSISGHIIISAFFVYPAENFTDNF